MNTQTVPIMEHEDVKKLFALYQQNGMAKEKSDVQTLLQHITFMETQFEKVFDELHDVRAQLDTLQDRGVKATVTKIVDAAGVKVNEAKAQLIAMKDSVIQAISGTVESAKQKGAAVLKNTVDFLKIHKGLSFLKGKLEQAVDSLRQGVARIENMKAELHEAKSHAGNAGRLMLGKEAKEVSYDSERGILAGIQKLMNKTGGLLAGISRAADSAMQKIEGLGQREEKGSVRQSLKDIKAARAGDNPPAPEPSRDKVR